MTHSIRIIIAFLAEILVGYLVSNYLKNQAFSGVDVLEVHYETEKDTLLRFHFNNSNKIVR